MSEEYIMAGILICNKYTGTVYKVEASFKAVSCSYAVSDGDTVHTVDLWELTIYGKSEPKLVTTLNYIIENFTIL